MAGPLDPIVRTAFRSLARLRGARAMHPRGLTLAARLDVAGDGPLPTGPAACTVRLSTSLGLPGALPDVLGLALRVEVDGSPVDVVAASCAGPDRLRRSLLWPALSWRGTRLTTLLPYASSAADRVVVLLSVDETAASSADVGRVAARLPMRVSVRAVGRRGDVQTGDLVVTGPATADVSFDPVLHPPPGWRLVPGWLSAVRAASYDASRDGRHAPAASLEALSPARAPSATP